MDETEWLTSTNPVPMLAILNGKTSDRKLRLFACACCRRVWHLYTEERMRYAVEVAERYADGQATWEEMEAAGEPLRYAPGSSSRANNKTAAPLWSTWGPWFGWSSLLEAVRSVSGYTARAHGAGKGQRLGQASLLRCIFGSPFGSVALDPRWLTSTVADLARIIYDERAFDKLPILADALMDAGCDSEEMLNHCRSDGPHVRGCWVVDLLLGKE